MFEGELSLRHIENLREKYQQGSVGRAFHRRSGKFYFERIAMQADNRGTLRPWLDVQGENKPPAAAIAAPWMQ